MLGFRNRASRQPARSILEDLHTLLSPPQNFGCKRTAFLAVLVLVATPLLWSSYNDTIRFTELETYTSLRGLELPDGSGVPVMMAEALSGSNYMPNTASSQFDDKTLNPMSGSSGTNSHAKTVANNFFGNSTSIAPGVTDIDVYNANEYLNTTNWPASNNPIVESQSVQNHSWVVQDSGDDPTSQYFNVAQDYAIQRDSFLAVVGLNNGSGTAIPELYGHLYNGISVGLSSGNHSRGTTQSFYGGGRTKPEIVSESSATSFATPHVSAAAALIYDLASGSIDHRAVKAILLAGANKEPFADWDQTATRPIDETYGAGLLDVFANYQIHQGGQQAAGSSIGTHGWNIEQVAPGSSDVYTFTVPEGFELRNLSILTTWDMVVIQNGLGFNYGIADLALSLDEGESNIQISDSTVDNIEHIWRDTNNALSAGTYTFTVSSADFTTTYAIAWRGELYQDYDLWQTIAFSESTSESDKERTADPDSDLIDNLTEMALGLDPEAHEQGLLPAQNTADEAGTLFEEIQIDIPTHTNDIAYAAETTTDLLTEWSSNSSDIELVEIKASTRTSPG